MSSVLLLLEKVLQTEKLEITEGLVKLAADIY